MEHFHNLHKMRSGDVDPTNRVSMERIKEAVIDQIYPLVEKVLSTDVVQPKDFINLYGKQNVHSDLGAVKSLKKGFEENENKRVANVFEAIVFQHVELSNWLGENAETIHTSEYDDIINGIDLIIQFADEESAKHLALGIDVTFGTRAIQKKFSRIKEEIDADELAKVKYFESHGFRGTLQQLPRVVIGIERDRVIELAALWMRKDNAGIGKHYVKEIILQEITLQLETYLQYAKSLPSPNAIKSFTRALNTLQKLKPEGVKSGIQEDGRQAAVQKDRVFAEIRQQMSIFR